MAEDETVVCKTQRTRTEDAKWLGVDNIYHKLHRPGYYDIGCTYLGSVGHLWFYFKTEMFSDTHFLHLFVLSRLDTSLRIGLSNNNHFLTEKCGRIYLSQSMKEIDLIDIDRKLNYAFTYSFTPLDLEVLENKTLYIGFKCYPKVGGPPENTLDHDYGALLKDPILSDFTIESADGHQFKVHQLILSTQSEVFCAMLKENTAEKQNSFVKLIDVNREDLYHILEFIYTGTIKDLQNCNCPNLMLLADRYDLKDLCELLQYALCELLTIDTVLDILLVADMCNSQYLKIASLKFIKQHPETLQTKAWKDFKNVDLVRKICEYVTPVTD